jgi:hypothetical protein
VFHRDGGQLREALGDVQMVTVLPAISVECLPVIHAAHSGGWVTGAPKAMMFRVLGVALSTAAASLATNAAAVGKAA